MVCPYCNTRNIPGSQVCAHCGAILREIKRAKPAPRERNNIGGAAKSLFGGGKYRSQHAAAQAKIKDLLAQVEARCEDDIKAQGASAQTRMILGALHLLQDQIERSVQEFQQAQRLGASGPTLFNNAGVALARRGNLQQSAEMFDRAAAHPEARNGSAKPPHANLGHALVRLAESQEKEGTPERAVREVQETLALDSRNPVHCNRLGLLYCQEERYDEALIQFRKALELSQGSDMAQADAHNNAGLAFALKGDVGAAAAEFQTALKLDAGHGRALCNQALLLLTQGEFDAAIERLQRAARLDPSSALIRNGYGYALSQALAINEGIREFKEAIMLDVQAFEPYYNQGKSYADEGLFDIAERYLARAVQTKPRSWQAQVGLGVIRVAQNQLSQAMQCFRTALDFRPDNKVILSNYGLCLAASSYYLEAERMLRRASEVAPKDPEMNLHLAWLYLKRGEITQSIGELEIALALDEKLAVAHNNYGLCQIQMAGYEEALRHFRRALQIEPELAPVHYHLGSTYALMNLFDAAVKEWELATKAEPTFPDAFSNLGVAHYRSGKYDLAVVEFRRVITMRQNRMEDFSNLALSYAKQGMVLRQQSRKPDDAKAKEAQDKQKIAVEMFDRALALQPNNVMLHSNRGLACYFANRPEEAMAEWTLVTKLDPAYARRRGKAQQSEFDDTMIAFIPVDTAARAQSLPPKTVDYLFQYAPSYDVDEWELILNGTGLEEVPELTRQSRHLERLLA